MLFSSIEFIFGFLPIALSGYWLLARRDTARLWFLLISSLVFYSYWDLRFTPLLIGSIVLNWTAANIFFRWRRRAVLVADIVANLVCLGIFKYLGFLESLVAAGTGWNPSLARLALPLGISFFTFHHIIYLVDLAKGRAPRYRFRDYALYIALFPQILAGPLVRYWEIVPQFAEPPNRPGWEGRLVRGMALFVMGLAKKLFLADPLASHVGPLFAKAAAGAVNAGEAWSAALAFPFQIYFDFSAYSDMAIGLALLFGFALPYNFAVPYRATSLQEFWRRWHMTLTRFLRDYLYIPLGGNRQGLPGHVVAIFVTLGLGGLWHGAGWTFIVWGALHGGGLAAGVVWRRWMPPIPVLALGAADGIPIGNLGFLPGPLARCGLPSLHGHDGTSRTGAARGAARPRNRSGGGAAWAEQSGDRRAAEAVAVAGAAGRGGDGRGSAETWRRAVV
jgi:alginate O-acetyltransferase complex protein AlgI